MVSHIKPRLMFQKQAAYQLPGGINALPGASPRTLIVDDTTLSDHTRQL
jgi:hypothetical protein